MCVCMCVYIYIYISGEGTVVRWSFCVSLENVLRVFVGLENVLCVVRWRMSSFKCVTRAHKCCLFEQCNVNKQMAADV